MLHSLSDVKLTIFHTLVPTEADNSSTAVPTDMTKSRLYKYAAVESKSSFWSSSGKLCIFMPVSLCNFSISNRITSYNVCYTKLLRRNFYRKG